MVFFSDHLTNLLCAGISSLKIKFNNILGYFVEVPTSKADQLATSYGSLEDGDGFQQCHTTKSGARFKTQVLDPRCPLFVCCLLRRKVKGTSLLKIQRLLQTEVEIKEAAHVVSQLEEEIFEEFRSKVCGNENTHSSSHGGYNIHSNVEMVAPLRSWNN